MKGFLLAISFLTRIPVPARIDGGSKLSGSTAWFSWVGLLVGAIAALPFLCLPPWYAALTSILLTVWVTGALHEDGLADTCDGVFGGRDPESRRAIMRDSRIGAYGTIGLWFLLTTR
ncbi:MAG: adenosylcobinamide-GDP ribazoletransferase, partial [Verrucomicrobiales bacterium]